MIKYVVLVIHTGQSLCVEADSHSTNLTFYGHRVHRSLLLYPVEFTPHLHTPSVVRCVVMLPSVSRSVKWPPPYSFCD